MTLTIQEKDVHAYISSDELVLEDFREADAEVVGFVREQEDVDAAVHACLRIGARALRVTGATLDGALVERSFDELHEKLGTSVEEFASRVDEKADELLSDEDGQLATALRGWREEVEKLLDETFDEQSKKSAIAKLEQLLEKARAEQTKAVRCLLDPFDQESPLGQWRAAILETVRDRTDRIEQSLADLSKQLGIAEAVAEEHEHVAAKGFDFELVVLGQLEEITAALEDVPEHVGNVAGVTGKVGDIVVTIDPALTPGRSARYVVEAKDKPMAVKKALDELEAAMLNRDACAGLMVFASQAVSPACEPFQWYDHKALVVLDKTTLDRQALRLACLWARWTACRDEHEQSQQVDVMRVEALIDAARLSLKTAKTIKADHTKARHAIDEGGRHLDALVCDLNARLDEIATELEGAGEGR